MNYFHSRDALIDWVRRVATESKMVITIKYSDGECGKEKHRVLFACERVYKKTKRKIEPSIEKQNVKKRKMGEVAEEAPKARETG